MGDPLDQAWRWNETRRTKDCHQLGALLRSYSPDVHRPSGLREPPPSGAAARGFFAIFLPREETTMSLTLRRGTRSSAPSGEPDHVVVGAGTAGCALAARLSADPGTRMLLVEAGSAADRRPLVQFPPRDGVLAGEPTGPLRTPPGRGRSRSPTRLPRGAPRADRQRGAGQNGTAGDPQAPGGRLRRAR
jgi:hypothetical protein